MLWAHDVRTMRRKIEMETMVGLIVFFWRCVRFVMYWDFPYFIQELIYHGNAIELAQCEWCFNRSSVLSDLSYRFRVGLRWLQLMYSQHLREHSHWKFSIEIWAFSSETLATELRISLSSDVSYKRPPSGWTPQNELNPFILFTDQIFLQ